MALDFPKPYPMESWTDEQWRRFHPVCDALEKYGYWVASEPLEGQFDQWLDGLKKSLKAIELRAEVIRRDFGYRGYSKSVLSTLHTFFPEPSWSVEVHPSKRVTT